MDPIDDVSREMEHEKEEFSNIKKKWRNRQMAHEKKRSILKERKESQTNG